MQDNKQENQFLDDDILRCKADLRKAFDAMVGSISEEAASEKSLQEAKDAPIFETEILNFSENILDDEVPSGVIPVEESGNQSTDTPPIQILSFDAMQRETLDATELSPEKPVSDSPISEKDAIGPEFPPVEPHTKQVEQIISENSHLRDELQTLVSQSEYAARQLGDMKSQLEKNAKDRDTLLEDIGELNKELTDKSEIITGQQQQVDSANEKLLIFSVLQEENLKLQKDLKRLGMQLSEFTSEKQHLQLEKERLLEDIEQMRAETTVSQTISEQAGRLRKELEKTDIILSQERARIRELDGTAKELEEELCVIRQQKQDLAEQLSAKERELEQVSSEHKRLHNEYNGFRNQENREISDMTFQLEDYRDKIRDIEAQMEQLRHEYEAFQTQANGEISILTEKNQQFFNESQMLSAEAAALKEDLKHSNQEIDRIQTIEIGLKASNEALSIERMSRQDLQQKYEQLQETVRSYEDIANELAEAKNENDQLRQLNHELKKQSTEITFSKENCYADDSSVEDDSAFGFADHNVSINSDIPVFNLADQIMEEHRRSSSNRRQRPEPSVSASTNNSISNVIRQYVASSNSANVVNKRAGIEYHPWTDQSLTSFQQDILREIVRKDMAFYCQKNHNAVDYSSLKNWK